MILKRGRGFYCTRAERAAIGARAAAAGRSVSGLLLDLVRDDGAARPVSGLTAQETGELLDGLRGLAAFLRRLPDRAADAGASQPAGSGAGGPDLEDATYRKDGMPAERVRLSISATDEEWAGVDERASRRGLSRSRYLVGLALPDACATGLHASLLPALSGVEQREVLEGVRRLCALLSQTGDPGAALTGMRERLAVLPDTGGSGLAGDGRERRSRPRSAARGEGGPVETDAGGLISGSPPAAANSSKRAKEVEAEPDPEPPGQGALF